MPRGWIVRVWDEVDEGFSLNPSSSISSSSSSDSCGCCWIWGFRVLGDLGICFLFFFFFLFLLILGFFMRWWNAVGIFGGERRAAFGLAAESDGGKKLISMNWMRV